MRITRPRHLLLAVVAVSILGHAEAQTKAEKKPAKVKGAVEALDPFGRPEGKINDQTARFYVWYDEKGWHLRTTAKGARNFHGTIRVKDAKIKSCVSVGLKKDKQKAGADDWQVNAARSELKFRFVTSTLSDGFDLVVDGDEGQIEFELLIEEQSKPKTIFVGRGLQHPGENPFSMPATPKRAEPREKP